MSYQNAERKKNHGLNGKKPLFKKKRGGINPDEIIKMLWKEIKNHGLSVTKTSFF